VDQESGDKEHSDAQQHRYRQQRADTDSRGCRRSRWPAFIENHSRDRAVRRGVGKTLLYFNPLVTAGGEGLRASVKALSSPSVVQATLQSSRRSKETL